MAKRTASQASEAAVKEFPITNVQDFDIDLLEVKDRGLKKDGTPVVVASYDHHKLTLNLTPGKSWTQVKWRIQASSWNDVLDTASMKVTLAVGEDVAATLVKIEDTVRREVLEKLQKVYPAVLGGISFDSLKNMWHPAVKDEQLFSAKVFLEGKNDERLTKFTIRPFQKPVVEVAGLEQLKPLLDENSGFIGAKAKVAVSVESIWIKLDHQSRPSKAGCVWKIQHMMVDLPEQVRWQVPNPFADASWDDEE